jgi:formylglycine-generating enzyme required for sulfatase activity
VTLLAGCTGTWTAFGVCDPNTCAAPTGACCFATGLCTVGNAAACATASGVYQGNTTTCTPNPCAAPVKTLCEVAEDDADGVAVLVGQRVTVQGIALCGGMTWSTTTREFQITDGNCCIDVFGGTLVPTVALGDLVQITGTVANYNGKTELSTPDMTVTVLSSGNSIPTPAVTTTGNLAAAGEPFESCLLTIRCASIVSGTWPAAGADANIVVDDGTGPVAMRIDKDTDIDGSPAPVGPFTITGIGDQYDTSSPYTTGWQIKPRSLADLASNCATGACCASAGTCAVTTQASCTGTWTLAGVCAPNPCTQPLPAGMVWIPAGNVRLGQAGVYQAEPVNDFYVEGFYIDRYEVSNARYKAFIDAGGYTTEAYWNPVGWAWRVANSITLPEYWSDPARHGGGVAGNEQFPVNGVSWWEADAYCRWAGVRLPTEAEWEKAAKAGCETHGDPGQCDASDTPTYPWGEGITGPQANYWESGDPYEYPNGCTTPVGYYDGRNHAGYQTIDSPSPYGLYDLIGNVAEWCSTKYAAYPYNPNDGRENPPVSYDECCRALRGGSCDPAPEDYLWCASRHSGYPSSRGVSYGNRGFRCAKDA